MATTVVVRTDLSGTSFVLDVSALELTANLSTLDFEVTHNGAIVSNLYAKTSTTQLTYTGTSVVLGTKIIARRVTSVVQSETTFLSTTTAAALTNALEKERLRIDELDARLSYTLAQVAAGGISIGSIPVINVAYGVSWDNDTTNAPSRNAAYDIINKLAVNSVAVFRGSVASVNQTGNNVSANTLNVVCGLGANTYRYALVRCSLFINSGGKSPALFAGSILDNALTPISTFYRPLSNAAFQTFTSIEASRIYTSTFSGTYTFTFQTAINASVNTDVFTLSAPEIEVIFFA
jgi:hypothetical protein